MKNSKNSKHYNVPLHRFSIRALAFVLLILTAFVGNGYAQAADNKFHYWNADSANKYLKSFPGLERKLKMLFEIAYYNEHVSSIDPRLAISPKVIVDGDTIKNIIYTFRNKEIQLRNWKDSSTSNVYFLKAILTEVDNKWVYGGFCFFDYKRSNLYIGMNDEDADEFTKNISLLGFGVRDRKKANTIKIVHYEPDIHMIKLEEYNMDGSFKLSKKYCGKEETDDSGVYDPITNSVKPGITTRVAYTDCNEQNKK